MGAIYLGSIGAAINERNLLKNDIRGVLSLAKINKKLSYEEVEHLKI